MRTDAVRRAIVASLRTSVGYSKQAIVCYMIHFVTRADRVYNLSCSAPTAIQDRRHIKAEILESVADEYNYLCYL